MATVETSGASLADLLDRMTVEGDLYERRADGKVVCYACGHRCTIFPGKRGICKVRFNDHGVLKVPWGYVAALQCDPTEKKPFNHILPGSLTLTFGMLGCDYHCPYCMAGDTLVVTNRGPIPLGELFEEAQSEEHKGDAQIAYPSNLETVTATGSFKRVRAIFKHPYSGQLVVIRPYYLPALRLTPDHRVYATSDPTAPPQPVEARFLSAQHYLAVPRHFSAELQAQSTIDAGSLLSQHTTTYRVPWKLSEADRSFIANASALGVSSREIGQALGKSGSYVRQVRRKIKPGQSPNTRTRGPLVQNGCVRFPKEHRPGIPAMLKVDPDLASLLGYYCAEGSVLRDKSRPNSYTLVFSFGKTESHLLARVRRLFARCFGIRPKTSKKQTTNAVYVDKSSAALLFRTLAGNGASQKRVPQLLFRSSPSTVEAFINSYVDGDGSRYANGKVMAASVSRSLASGVAWLALRSGYLPHLYDNEVPASVVIMGRKVNCQPHLYSVGWYEDSHICRKAIITDTYYLVPIREIVRTEFDGFVYNMEIEEEHSYLANFFAVRNCQNYITSQALRDRIAGAEPALITPGRLVQLARGYGAQLIGSSYNEPLITSEWAVAIFREAKAAGLRTCYISNGNATPEVLQYLRPWTDGYKIDLKAFNDKNYRFLGGTLESVLQTIKMVYAMGFWTEIVTLVIPGYNDSDDELRAAAEFIASVSPFIPWHVTAFHKDYKMTDPANTPPETLIRAATIGEGAGLRYVYAGNLPGRVGKYEHTFCHQCGALLIARSGYVILQNRLAPTHGRCPDCRTVIPGLWT